MPQSTPRPRPEPTAATNTPQPAPTTPPSVAEPSPQPQPRPQPQPIRQVIAPAPSAPAETETTPAEIPEEYRPLFKRYQFAVVLVLGSLVLGAGYYGQSHALVFWGLLVTVLGATGTFLNPSPLPPKIRG